MLARRRAYGSAAGSRPGVHRLITLALTLIAFLAAGCRRTLPSFRSRECQQAASEDWHDVGVGWDEENSPLFTLDPLSTEPGKVLGAGVPGLISLAYHPEIGLFYVGGDPAKGGAKDGYLVQIDPPSGSVVTAGRIRRFGSDSAPE